MIKHKHVFDLTKYPGPVRTAFVYCPDGHVIHLFGKDEQIEEFINNLLFPVFVHGRTHWKTGTTVWYSFYNTEITYVKAYFHPYRRKVYNREKVKGHRLSIYQNGKLVEEKLFKRPPRGFPRIVKKYLGICRDVGFEAAII